MLEQSNALVGAWFLQFSEDGLLSNLFMLDASHTEGRTISFLPELYGLPAYCHSPYIF